MQRIGQRPQAAPEQQEQREEAATDGTVIPLPAEVDPDLDQHFEH
jgi:hypothetical protein